MINHLIITEGENTEPKIFEIILKKYGFNVICASKLNVYEGLTFETTELSNNKVNVIISQAPRTRLTHLLKLYEDKDIELKRIFSKGTNFSSVFLIFDVDHTKNKVLDKIFAIHNDETDNGLLLVSSPCIEILTEPQRKGPLITSHLSNYKKKRNVFIHDKLHLNKNCKEYICDNFEDNIIYFLDKNVNDFNEKNIMEHPKLVIDRIKRNSIKSELLVFYWYYTTVIYVFISYICGLTKDIDNYEIVRNFFINHKCR